MLTQRVPYNFIGSYNVQRDEYIDRERSLNMYMLPARANQDKFVMAPASGFLNPLEVGNGPIRAQFVFKDFQYVVSGNEVYSVDSGLVTTLRGTLSTGAGYVGISANEKEVIFVDGVDGYLWNTQTSMFSTIAFGFALVPADVAMLDNYFIVIDKDTITWYISALNNGTSWNVLNNANFISKPDQLQAVHVLKRRLYFFGKTGTEVWYDAGAADFPFRRDNNSLFEHGCVAPKTIQSGFELMFYLANNEDGAAGIMMVEGISKPIPISTPAIDLFLQNADDAADSEAILYRENGIIFYQISFRTDDRTFVYVVNTQQWHELQTHDEKGHLAGSHAFFFGKHYIGDNDGDSLYELSYKFFTYNGDLIRGIRIGPPFYEPNHRRIRIDRFELEAVTGFPGNDLIQLNLASNAQLDTLIKSNDDAEVILFVSRDGGKTFSNGRRATLGRLGQYGIRTIWNRLGVNRGRRIVFKVEFPYRVPFYIIGAYLTYSVLPE